MGAGGLLAEIPTRPLPRAAASPAPAQRKAPQVSSGVGPRIAALLLAAGQSRRMGGPTSCWPRSTACRWWCARRQRLLASHARPIVAVLGNQADAVDAALDRLPVERVRNPAFAEGLSTSLKRGLAALPPEIDGAIVCLGDMPLVTGRDLDRLIAAFNPLEGRAIIVPTRHGKRGNPVLWARRFFAEMAELAGDVGAQAPDRRACRAGCRGRDGSDGVLIDIDTPDALAALRDKTKPSAA